MKKRAAFDIRTRKDGKPYKADLLKAREFLKKNFEDIPPANIPDSLKGYARQIEAGKRRAAIRDPETGRLINRKQAAVVEKAIKAAAIETGIPEEKIRSTKDLYIDIFRQEVQRRQVRMIPADVVKDMAKDSRVKKIIVYDQYGNKKEVSASKAAELITKANKEYTQRLNIFAPEIRTEVTDLGATLKIFVPSTLSKTGKPLSDTQLNNTFAKLSEDGQYSAGRSPKGNARKRAASKKGKGKKSNSKR